MFNKTLKNPFLLGLLISLFIACGGDGDNMNGIDIGNCKITWKLDGQSMEETPTICVYLDNTMNLGLVGSTDIFLQVNNLTDPGTYDLGDNTDAIILMDMGSTRLGGISGSITVSEISSSKAKGTFSGSFQDIQQIGTGPTFNVTDGKFESDF